MIEINLLPRKKKIINRFVQMVLVVGVVAVLVISSLAGLFVYQTMQIKKVSNEMEDIEKQLVKLQETLVLMDKYEAQLAVLNTQMGIINKLNTNRTYWAKLLDDVADRVPSKMWLRTIMEQVDNTGKHKLVMTGTTYTNFSVADFMTNIEKSPFFQGVDLVHVTKGSMFGRDIVSFELHAVMKS